MRTILIAVGVAVVAAGCAKASRDPLHDVDIRILSHGDGLWTVKVVNGKSTSISVDWDASSYVGSSGASLGRLIRGTTRRMDIGKPQAPSPVAAGSWVEEVVIPEQIAEAETPSPIVDETGTMHVVIVIDGKTSNWSGPSTRAASSSPHCFEPTDRDRSDGAMGRCGMSLDECETLRRLAPSKIDNSVAFTPCTPSASLFCFTYKDAGSSSGQPPSEICAPTTADCDAQRGVQVSKGGAVENCAAKK